jgi:hypothetical protein
MAVAGVAFRPAHARYEPCAVNARGDIFNARLMATLRWAPGAYLSFSRFPTPHARTPPCRAHGVSDGGSSGNCGLRE